MDSNYNANILKWLPVQGPILEKWFNDSMELEAMLRKLSWDIVYYVEISVNDKASNQEVNKSFY